MNWLIVSGFAVTIAVNIITIFASWKNIIKKFSLNRNWQDSKEYLPIFINLLEDLKTLHYAFLHHSNIDQTICPNKEHRAPTITEYDSEKEGEFSIAQRHFYLLTFGINILDNCRRIIYTIPKGQLLKTKALCKEIKRFLDKKENGKKFSIDYLIGTLSSTLKKSDSKDFNNKDLLHQTAETMLSFYMKLDETLEKEFSSLID